jgi:rhamnosyltransferase
MIPILPDSSSPLAPSVLNHLRVALVIPTYNARRHWQQLYAGIRRQSLVPQQVMVIDSSSNDGTVRRAGRAGFVVLEIDKQDFNHGGTRQLAAERLPDVDILIYLTQDAIPLDRDAFRNLVSAFDDPKVGAAFGRQMPRPEATLIEAHARLFNYPAESTIRSWESRKNLGFKSIFFSNSFGAYRRAALMSVGGFSADVIFGEDTLVVAQMHRAGWKTAYVADALVQHSHSYSIGEEFRRYFDIGVLHTREAWLLEQFGSVSGEGKKFVLSERQYLSERNPRQIPNAFLHTVAKYLGYKMGRQERRMPAALKYYLGMNKSYWLRRHPPGDHSVVSYGSVKKNVAP